MKIIIPGGSGQIGQYLQQRFEADGHSVVILSRSTKGRATWRAWDGKTLGDWAKELDGADLVINLAGRTVNCRYSEENLQQMMDSRVDSTRVIGEAIATCAAPPKLWLQMTTATIYAHTIDGPANTEKDGVIGGDEPNVPAYWKRSIDIAVAWEKTLDEAETPATRKIALRTAMVMSADKGGVFDVLSGLAKKGLGGAIGNGKQYISWTHAADFARVVYFLIEHQELSGVINVASPNPIRQADFAKIHRASIGVKIGLPAFAWMVKLGAIFLRTDAELVLKSRKVVPQRLLDAGFEFKFSEWRDAAADLANDWRS